MIELSSTCTYNAFRELDQSYSEIYFEYQKSRAHSGVNIQSLVLDFTATKNLPLSHSNLASTYARQEKLIFTQECSYAVNLGISYKSKVANVLAHCTSSLVYPILQSKYIKTSYFHTRT